VNTELFVADLAAPAEMLLLLVVANGMPVLGKTVRGVLLSLVATALTAIPLGFDWSDGALIALLAMLGDLASSFVKRRLGRAPSSMAPGLDQIPESLLPALAFKTRLGLTAWDVAGVVFAFVLLELLLSRVLFGMRLRDRPY
jgi:CDP-2,3-bis-(O-geranylgeranyl)-sn-glycerol synthase